MPRILLKTAWGVLVFGFGAAVSYRVFLRTACLTWGATEKEVVRPMPGDELLPGADVVASRAVTIGAPPKAIWPWLVQMGSGRAGAYTYDWIENLLGLDMHSSERVVPELQGLAEGDTFALGEGGAEMRAEVIDRERALVWRSDDGNWVWAFGLYPGDGVTRLVSRNRIATRGASPAARLVAMLAIEPGSLVMERKMLLGIKQRAERLNEDAAAG